MEEKTRIQDFIKEISECLDDRVTNEAFRKCFKKYKVSTPQPNIDEFVHELCHCFLGESEHAVCHLEVVNYQKRKIILLRLAE